MGLLQTRRWVTLDSRLAGLESARPTCAAVGALCHVRRDVVWLLAQVFGRAVCVGYHAVGFPSSQARIVFVLLARVLCGDARLVKVERAHACVQGVKDFALVILYMLGLWPLGFKR